MCFLALVSVRMLLLGRLRGKAVDLAHARLYMLERIAFPLMVQQTDQCFVWLLLTDPSLVRAFNLQGGAWFHLAQPIRAP